MTTQKRLNERSSGILLHISSLSSPYGIGDVGPTAYQFVDFLKKAHQTYWQILPLNPTNGIFGHSPYSSHSAFAANSLFISPDLLVKDGWLTESQLPLPKKEDWGSDDLDYQQAMEIKGRVLQLAFQRFQTVNGATHKLFVEFCAQNNFWLADYALFVTLKKYFQDEVWVRWPDPIKKRDPQTLQDLTKQYAEDITKVKFEQFIFYKQWESLRSYCQQNGVQLIGDIPIYVNDDSVDVWRHPEFFKLTEDFSPEFVAGVPPDYFSATGQRWGNPVYRWEKLQQTGYHWWLERLKHNLQLFDVVRIDHFRGLVSFWQIPVQEQTAIRGHWGNVPWNDFFTLLKKHFASLPIIAEDLGIITPEVTQAMKKYGFPGMKVLLFAFDGDSETHPYIPKNYPKDCVVYTGTHDNNTARGWFDHEANHQAKERFFHYIGKTLRADEVAWEMIRLAITSVADVALIPMQDVLGLGQDARMNTPATTHGNWRWRMTVGALTPDIAVKLSRLTQDSQRG
jgi:4-alpha-glucanotransferase